MIDEKPEVKAFVRILDIPIYRCTFEKHAKALTTARERFASMCPRTDDLAQRKRRDLGTYFDKANWYPWRFNEIVGYVSLVTRRGEIVGELFLRESKRIVGRPKGRLIYHHEPLFMHVRREWKSKEIFDAMCSKLAELQKQDKRLRRRVLDTEILTNIGAHLDWRTIVNSVFREPKIGPKI